MKTSHQHETTGDGAKPSDSSWFDQPSNVRKIIIGLIVVCVCTVLADLFYTNDHPYFAVETLFGFQAWVGFIAFVVIVFLGRLLRPVVRREENYYD